MMSDSGLFLDDVVNEKAETSSRVERLLKWSVVALAAVLIVEAVWFFVVVPSLPLKTIEMQGADLFPRGAIYAASGLTEKTSFFTINPAEIKRGVEALPEVESVTVTRRFPDGVKIGVVRRTPVAVALVAAADGRSVPVSIDRKGTVFQVGASSVLPDAAGPIISGLLFEDPRPGVRLPEFLQALVSDLARLRAENPALLDTISEIRIVKKNYDAYELVLYPTYRPVRVKIGSQLNEDVLRYMMLLLDVLASKGIETDELDFRTGTAAYRIKEG